MARQQSPTRKFPRLKKRGLIEAKHAPVVAISDFAEFPRLKKRGLIEASDENEEGFIEMGISAP